MHDWRGRTVVITGASAGLGRATALQFAQRNASLVLAARRAEELEETARLCEQQGGSALAVPTDVTHEDQVAALVDTAIACTGRIDVWINNAGVTIFAPLEVGPFDEHRRVLETNLYGPIFAARAVLPVFRRQRHGILINVGSLLGKIGQAFVPSYVISKFGLRGLSEALRVEVADEPDIHVCSIFPYAIDTQHFQHAASRVGRQAHAMPPIQSPESVARAIVKLAERPRRELHVPRAAVLVLALHALLPRTVERVLLRALQTWHFDDAPQPLTSGNLYEPAREPAAVHGRRRPLLGSVRFVCWVARELLQLGAQAVQRPGPAART